MDLIDKELIEDCIKSGERLRRQFESRFDDFWFEKFMDWWNIVYSKLQSTGTIPIDKEISYIKDDPVWTMQLCIDDLKNLEKKASKLKLSEIVTAVSEKDSLRLMYTKLDIYDVDDINTRLRINEGFRKDLLELCFENPARPLRKIPISKLEEINPKYNLRDLKKKDGQLSNLYKHWSKKFNVNKEVIKEMIKLENTPKGYFILISKNIAVEF